MTYNWYKIFNLTEFEALDLPSRAYTSILEEIGERTILVTKGNKTSILYEGVFLPINNFDKNPFEFDGYAVYIDENDDVYLGIEVDEN